MQRDARRLGTLEQQRIRTAVIEAVQAGESQTEAARRFGVSRQSVNAWIKAWRLDGEQALRARKRGPRRSQRALDPHQEQEVAAWVRQYRVAVADPDRPTRREVATHIHERYGLELSLTTIARYLQRSATCEVGSGRC